MSPKKIVWYWKYLEAIVIFELFCRKQGLAFSLPTIFSFGNSLNAEKKIIFKCDEIQYNFKQSNVLEKN